MGSYRRSRSASTVVADIYLEKAKAQDNLYHAQRTGCQELAAVYSEVVMVLDRLLRGYYNDDAGKLEE